MKAEMPLPEGMQDNLSSRQLAICAVQPVLGHELSEHQKQAMCKMQWLFLRLLHKGKYLQPRYKSNRCFSSSDFSLVQTAFATRMSERFPYTGSVSVYCCSSCTWKVTSEIMKWSTCTISRWKTLLDFNQRSFSKLWGNSCSNSKSQWSLHLLLRNGELGTDQPAFYIALIPR